MAKRVRESVERSPNYATKPRPESELASKKRAEQERRALVLRVRRMWFEEHIDVRLIAVRTRTTEQDVRRIIRGKVDGWLETQRS